MYLKIIKLNFVFCFRRMSGLTHFMLGLCIYALMQNIQATSPSQFIEDINGYRRACKSIGWEPKQGMDTLNLIILIFIRLSDFM